MNFPSVSRLFHDFPDVFHGLVKRFFIDFHCGWTTVSQWACGLKHLLKPSEEVNASTSRRKRALVRVQNVASSWLLPLARRETLQTPEIMDWEAPRADFHMISIIFQ